MIYFTRTVSVDFKEGIVITLLLLEPSNRPKQLVPKSEPKPLGTKNDVELIVPSLPFPLLSKIVVPRLSML